VDCDVIVLGTPIDLRRLIDFKKPAIRATYELEEVEGPTLEKLLKEKGFL